MNKNTACALAAALLGSACSSAPAPPPFRTVADTKLLMQAVVDPSADAVWDSVRTIITAQGTEEIRPRSSDEWTAVRNHAVALAESGNLMMMAPRARDGGEWMQRARELVDTSERAIRAAERKNAEDLFDAGGDIYVSCSNCHQHYMDAIVNANK